MSRYATALARMFASAVLAVLGTAAGVAATSGEGRIVFARSQPGIPSDSVVTDDTLLSTAGIHAISAHGPKVAIRYDGGKTLEFFGRVEVWQPGEAPRRYPADLCVLCEVALSRGRVAWSEYEESNHSAGWVSTTRVWPVRVKDVAYANEEDGEHVGAMKADRNLILFEMHVRRSTSIHSIDAGGRVRVVRRYAAPVTLLDAERGLLAIRVDAGRVEIVRADGRAMTALAATAARAAFAGDELVVQSKNSLNVWSPTTGTQRGRSLSIPVGSVLADADGALAVVLLKDRRVLVVDLLSGRRRTMRPPGYGRVLADIEPGGLYVATQSKTAREGRLQFIPRSSLTP